jgi:hypothetical protein
MLRGWANCNCRCPRAGHHSRGRGPRDRLADLHRDVAPTKTKIRAALDELADRHRIPQRDVTYAMDGYADNLLSDVVYNVATTVD